MSKRNIDRGKLLQEKVSKSGISVKVVTNRAGYQRPTYYTHIEKSDLSFDILEKYGKALNYDFSIDIPEMKEYFKSRNPNISNDIGSAEYWKSKYYDLLEKYNTLLEKGKYP